MPQPAVSALAAVLRGEADPAFSPVPIWWWSGDVLERGRLRWQMQQLLAGGVSQAVVLNLAPSGPLYGALADRPAFFSEAWWELFLGVCEDAAGLGFSLWCYDQLGFSGADVQGRVIAEHPWCRGEALERVAAGRLPAGARGLAPLLEGMACARPHGFDYLAPAAGAALLDALHGELERRAGAYLGSVVVGTFQDELPSLPTWSRGFLDAFGERRGYDLAPHLAALWEDRGSDGEGVRGDYQRTRAELAEEAFFRPLARWHERHGLLAGCDQQHPARAGCPFEATQQYADYQRTHRWFSAPGSDHWGDAKVHSSLAHLYGRPRTWVEAFHSTGWGGTLEETLDWLLPWLRAGATLYDPHAVYYSTPGASWEWAPPSTCWRQPYWRHHRLFADTVTRLCAALAWGHHACDVGVLFPTATVQAELLVDTGEELLGQPRGVSPAQDAYLDVVGRMSWFEPVPGALDRDGRDFDVLDEDSVARAGVEDGALVIGDERYRSVVLPGCRVLEGPTLDALAAFVEGGGLVVTVGAPPAAVAGLRGEPAALARFRALATRSPGVSQQSSVGRLARHTGPWGAGGGVRHAATAGELAAALAGVPRTATAVAGGGPVAAAGAAGDGPGPEGGGRAEALAADGRVLPTLVRTDGESTAVFCVAAYPGATLRGRDWQEAGYDFDPARYAERVTLTVRGAQEPAAVWDPGTATATPVRASRDGDALTVDVPFTATPCALVVFGSAALTVGADGDGLPSAVPPAAGREGLAMASPPAAGDSARTELLAEWTGTLLPTGENRWGDLALPPSPGPPAPRISMLWHRVGGDLPEPPGEGGGWAPARATFGPFAWWVGPADADALPRPGGPALPPPGEGWEPVVWSQAGGRAGPGDPKGYVPEDLLDCGVVQAGRAVLIRAPCLGAGGAQAALVVGATAHAEAWWNGEPVALASSVAYHRAAVPVRPGDNVLELRLTARATARLRASWVLRAAPEADPRPEWLAFPAAADPSAAVTLHRQVVLPSRPAEAVVQLGTIGGATLAVNGTVVARHGETDNYAARRDPRVRRYDLAPHLRAGANVLVIALHEPAAAAVLDGAAGCRDQTADPAWLVTDGSWCAQQEGRALALAGLAEVPHDPRWVQLHPRPHPLPHGRRLEGGRRERDLVGTATAFPGTRDREWFAFRLPPGATALRLPLLGTVAAFVAGDQLAPGAGAGAYRLPRPAAAGTWCLVRVEPPPGPSGGALWQAPGEVTAHESGPLALGDWQDLGMADWAGGVRYRASVDLAATTTALDLGRVRGTAELRVNGHPAGCRLWAPYRFGVGGLFRGSGDDVEVEVYGTLAPHVAASSPTPWVLPGQRAAGLFGPVTAW